MGWEQWLLSGAAVIAAIAFVVLVIFLIRMIQESLKSLTELTRLIRDSTSMIVDVKDKIHAFDGIFKKISDVSTVVQRSQVCAIEEDEEDSKSSVIIEAIEWALIGATLWRKFKTRK